MISWKLVERGRFVVAALALVVVAVSMACAKPAPRSEFILSVTNALDRTITEVRKKPCGDLELAFVPIENSRLGPGETRGVPLPSTCIDLVAFDSRGDVVGEQHGLRMLPGARWKLRR